MDLGKRFKFGRYLLYVVFLSYGHKERNIFQHLLLFFLNKKVYKKTNKNVNLENYSEINKITPKELLMFFYWVTFFTYFLRLSVKYNCLLKEYEL